MCQKEPLDLEKKGKNEAKAGKGNNERNKPVKGKQWYLIYLRPEFGLPRSSYGYSSIYIEMISF